MAIDCYSGLRGYLCLLTLVQIPNAMLHCDAIHIHVEYYIPIHKIVFFLYQYRKIHKEILIPLRACSGMS